VCYTRVFCWIYNNISSSIPTYNNWSCKFSEIAFFSYRTNVLSKNSNFFHRNRWPVLRERYIIRHDVIMYWLLRVEECGNFLSTVRGRDLQRRTCAKRCRGQRSRVAVGARGRRSERAMRKTGIFFSRTQNSS